MVFILAAVVLTLFVVTSHAEDHNNISPDVKKLIPKDVTDELEKLPEEEIGILKELLKKKSFQHESEFLLEIKEKSFPLYKKAICLKEHIQTKVETLGPEARKLAENYFAFALDLFRSYIMGERKTIEEFKEAHTALMDEFEAMSEDAKKELKDAFPVVTKIVDVSA